MDNIETVKRDIENAEQTLKTRRLIWRIVSESHANIDCKAWDDMTQDDEISVFKELLGLIDTAENGVDWAKRRLKETEEK